MSVSAPAHEHGWRLSIGKSDETGELRRLSLLAGLLAAFGLRLHQLGAESLWYDETVSVYLARQSIPAMLAHTAGDIHPPGYYLLLHGWHALTQPTLLTGLNSSLAGPASLPAC